MKYAADFRSIARDSLRGKWLFAVAAGLVAVLLGGISSDGPEIKFHIDAAGASASLELAGQNIYSTSKGLGPELSTFPDWRRCLSYPDCHCVCCGLLYSWQHHWRWVRAV